MSSDIMAKAAEHWTKVTESGPRAGVKNWWQSPAIWRHINGLAGSADDAGQHTGFARILERKAGGALARGISVGCGTGAKEMRLIRMGIVEHFDLYEITEARIAIGIAEAEKFGISGKVTWHRADAFVSCTRSDYDVVHWNNALHHMLDVDAAVAWSMERLRPGGLFAMDDFVGPSRFQWTDLDLTLAADFRRSLPQRLMSIPGHPGRFYNAELPRPTIEAMIAMDPTESADSGRILDVVRARVPGVQIIPTGGVIYQLGLRDILGNFTDSPEDQGLLALALLLDREITALTGQTHYAIAVGAKA